MAEARPGFEETSGPHRAWLTRSGLVFGLVAGLVLAVGLIALMPDVRTHLFGGTHREETTVVDVRLGTRSDGRRPLTTYELRWRDEDGAHTATYRRSGPPRRDVGETWSLWVSSDGTAVEEESPLVTWLVLGLGLPLTCLVLDVLWEWRRRVMGRMVQRDVERGVARRARRSARGTPDV